MLDKNICSSYNANRTIVLQEVTAMTTLGYIIVILGAGSIAVNLMRLIDRIDQPRRSRRHAC